MRTVVINDHKLKLYDSIDELPITNFHKYNKCVLIDTGIGSDLDSVDSHIVNIAKFIKQDNKMQAMQELQNLRQNLYMIISEVSPKHLAFAALIQSIDNKPLDDLSDETLQGVIKLLNECPRSLIVEILEDIKKKLTTELETYFPNDFDSAKEKEAYTMLKRKVIMQLNDIAEESNSAIEIADIDKALFNLYKPKNFTGKESEEIKYDRQFETSCMVISQKTNLNAKKMTVLEFYNTLSNLQKQAEAEIKAYKHNKRS